MLLGSKIGVGSGGIVCWGGCSPSNIWHGDMIACSLLGGASCTPLIAPLVGRLHQECNVWWLLSRQGWRGACIGKCW
jgi:hypothetical protein